MAVLPSLRSPRSSSESHSFRTPPRDNPRRSGKSVIASPMKASRPLVGVGPGPCSGRRSRHAPSGGGHPIALGPGASVLLPGARHVAGFAGADSGTRRNATVPGPSLIHERALWKLIDLISSGAGSPRRSPAPLSSSSASSCFFTKLRGASRATGRTALSAPRSTSSSSASASRLGGQTLERLELLGPHPSVGRHSVWRARQDAPVTPVTRAPAPPSELEGSSLAGRAKGRPETRRCSRRRPQSEVAGKTAARDERLPLRRFACVGSKLRGQGHWRQLGDGGAPPRERRPDRVGEHGSLEGEVLRETRCRRSLSCGC